MNDLLAALSADKDWSKLQVELGIEFDFKCAYCDKDLMASVDNHREWQIDHIVPTSKHGKDERDNLALSCRTCNTIKHSWNPLSKCDRPGHPTKQQLIQIARTYISGNRESEKIALDRYNAILAKYR